MTYGVECVLQDAGAVTAAGRVRTVATVEVLARVAAETSDALALEDVT